MINAIIDLTKNLNRNKREVILMSELPTGRGLLIAEKQDSRRIFEQVWNQCKDQYPYDLEFDALHGHVVELKKPGEIKPEWKTWKLENLPMIPDKWEYRVEDNPKRYNAVKEHFMRGNFDFIVNGGDFEREGQLIQDAFYQTLPKPYCDLPEYRLWSNDMSSANLTKAYGHLYKMDDVLPGVGKVKDLAAASFIRARFDWLLGLNSTQLLSLKCGAMIPSGRVIIPTLKLFVNRELEIRNFVSHPYWMINATFKAENGTYVGTLLDQDNKNEQFTDKNQAEQALKSLTKQGQIIELTKKQVAKSAPSYYTNSSLQGVANDIYKMSLAETTAALQKLYEWQVLSYPRPDAPVITTEMVKEIPDMLKVADVLPELAPFTTQITQKAIDSLATNKRFVDNKKVSAHTALMPTAQAQVKRTDKGIEIRRQTMKVDPKTKQSVSTTETSLLTPNEEHILYLVTRSLVLSLLPTLKQENTTVITQVGQNKFKTTGAVVLDPGWTVAIPNYQGQSHALPDLKQNEPVSVVDSELDEGKTTPPSRYTVKSIMNALINISRVLTDKTDKDIMAKAKGLGRPSTRETIIEHLVKNKMVSFKKQKYYATDFGISIIENLGNIPLTSPTLTARWEERLEEVEQGQLSADQVYQQMVKYTKQVINDLDQLDLRIEHIPETDKSPVGKLANGNEVTEGKNGYFDSEFSTFMDEVKEAKAAGEVQPEFHGFWLGKKIDTEGMKMTGSFSRKDVAKLLKGEVIIKHFLWKRQKRESDARLQLNKRYQLEFVKSNTTDNKVTKGQVAGINYEKISGKKDDKPYSFYKLATKPPILVSSTIAGHTVTDNDLASLVQNGEFTATDFISKKGKKFTATLELDKKQRLQFKLDRTPRGTTVVQGKDYQVNEVDGTSKNGNHYAMYYFYQQKLPHGEGRMFKDMGGHQFTNEELAHLAQTGALALDNLVGKSGKAFSATIKFNTKTGMAEYSFNN